MEKAADPVSSDHRDPPVCGPLSFRQFSSLLFLGGLVIFFYCFFKLDPTPDNPDWPAFRVVSAAVSPCPLTPRPAGGSSDHYLTAKWHLNLVAENPNRNFDLHYNTHMAFLYYGDNHVKDKLMLAATPLPLLSLAATKRTTLNVTFTMVRTYIGDDLAKELATTTSEPGGCYGSARLGVKLFGSLRFVPPIHGVLSSFFCDLSRSNNVSECKASMEKIVNLKVALLFGFLLWFMLVLAMK